MICSWSFAFVIYICWREEETRLSTLPSRSKPLACCGQAAHSTPAPWDCSSDKAELKVLSSNLLTEMVWLHWLFLSLKLWVPFGLDCNRELLLLTVILQCKRHQGFWTCASHLLDVWFMFLLYLCYCLSLCGFCAVGWGFLWFCWWYFIPGILSISRMKSGSTLLTLSITVYSLLWSFSDYKFPSCQHFLCQF